MAASARPNATSMKISSLPPMIDIRFHRGKNSRRPRRSGAIWRHRGTRRGVKCLHAHYACFLAGEDDPVGKWVHHQLGFGVCRLEPNDPGTTVVIEGTTSTILTQMSPINERLAHGSYADPAELTNIIGEITDAFDDALRIHDVGRPHDIDLAITGPYGQGSHVWRVDLKPASTRQSIEIQQKNCSACSQPTTKQPRRPPRLLETDGDLLERCVSWSPSGGSTQHKSILARRPRHDSIPTPSLNPPTLSGNRLQLRPLNDDDFSSGAKFVYAMLTAVALGTTSPRICA